MADDASCVLLARSWGEARLVVSMQLDSVLVILESEDQFIFGCLVALVSWESSRPRPLQAPTHMIFIPQGGK